MLGVLKASRKVEVHFVDFGNREIVECEELRDMPAMILSELPVQAVACSLCGIDEAASMSVWSPADIDTFSEMVYDQLLQVYFTPSQNSDGQYLVHLLNDQENINRNFLRSVNKLSRSYLSPVDRKASGDASVPAQSRRNVEFIGMEDRDGVALRRYTYETSLVGDQLNCVAAYVVSPAQFYLHKSSDVDALDMMMEELNAEYENSVVPQTLNVGVGEPCCARYSEDNRWYRAKLTTMSEAPSVSVDFVDYGNTETVDTDVVLRLRSHYFTQPVRAVHCRLAGVIPSTGSDWSDEAAAFFEELLGDSSHTVKVVSVEEFVHTVEMKSVAQKLIDGGYAKQKAGPAAASKKLSSWDSERTVESHGSYSSLLSGGGNGISAVDSDSWSDTRKSEMKKPTSWDSKPTVKSHGSYSSPMSGGGGGGFAVDNDSWSDTQKSEMKKPSSWDSKPTVKSHGSYSSPMSGGGSAGFAVDNDWGDTQKTTSSVSALLSFSPVTITVDTRHSVVVSWVVSPSEFYCQLVDNCRVIEKLSSDLRQTYQSSRDHAMSAGDCTADRPCVAFYGPDRSWYRGRIVSCASDQVTVFYVDYGNTEVVRLGQVRQAVPQFMTSQPVQAVKCCLRGADKMASEWTDDEITAFDKAVSAPGLSCRFLNKRDDVYIVELSDQTGGDLTSQFCSKSTSVTSVTSYVHECGLKQKDEVLLEVVYVAEGCTVFNCHIVGQTDDLDKLMADLAADCESRPALLSFPDVGQPCAALYSEDSSWYRATIDSIPADDASHRIVKFVDYGNMESCSVSSLRELDAQFLRVPVQRVDCRLRGMTASSLDAVVDELLSQQFTATVVGVDGSGVATVELKTAETGELFASTHEDLFTPSTMSLPTSQPPQSPVDVYVTHIISLSDFYIQTASVEPQLTELSNQLVEEYDGNDDGRLKLSDMTVGSLCCARYSADGLWYRAVIEDIRDDTVSVRFVDYGNSDAISRVDVRRLTDRFSSVPACAWRCQLAVVSAQSSSAICWTDTEQQTFVDLTEGGEKELSCSFVSHSQSPYSVILKDGEVDIGAQLYGSLRTVDVPSSEPPVEGSVTAAVTGLPVAEAPSDTTEVCITTAESPSDFYLQLMSAEDELAQLADELTEEYDCLSAGDCHMPSVDVGGLCCARYSADSAWYRAVVTEMVSASQVRVLFVDYGNTDVVSTSADVKLLRHKFCTKPPFVYRCALAGVSQRAADDWTNDEKTRFAELTVAEDEAPAVFTCQFVSSDADTGRHSVSLKSAGDVDVSSMFIDTSDVAETADIGQVTSRQQLDTTFQPPVISPGKHRVSHFYLCDSHPHSKGPLLHLTLTLILTDYVKKNIGWMYYRPPILKDRITIL